MSGWLRARLFPDPVSACASAAAAALIAFILYRAADWGIVRATFSGASRDACTAGGACWAVVEARLGQFVYGFYPPEQRWRIDAGFALLGAGALALLLGPPAMRRTVAVALFLLFPPMAALLLAGGWLGLPAVGTDRWGGLTVTLILAISAMAVSLPMGVLLALVRSYGPALSRALAAVLIEFLRGVPLIALLFTAAVVLPLALPGGGGNLFGRVLLALCLYASAYMAEVMRGALLAIPDGQWEAARSLGLSSTAAFRLAILPQMTAIALPGIANTFIGLLKDTSLVLIIGVFDLLAIVQLAVTDSKWLGLALEAYAFAGAVYFLLCLGISQVCALLERRLSWRRPA